MSQTDTGPSSYWKITAAFGDYFYLSSMLFGGTRRLDVMSTAANEPWPAPAIDSSGQYWKLTKVP
jgi:hypothetical protein